MSSGKVEHISDLFEAGKVELVEGDLRKMAWRNVLSTERAWCFIWRPITAGAGMWIFVRQPAPSISCSMEWSSVPAIGPRSTKPSMPPPAASSRITFRRIRTKCFISRKTR